MNTYGTPHISFGENIGCCSSCSSCSRCYKPFVTSGARGWQSHTLCEERRPKTSTGAAAMMPRFEIHPTMKPHKFSELVNELRDESRLASNTQKLRERLSRVLHKYIEVK